MIRILFVCLGNICRSPMAEFIFKDLVKKDNLENSFYIMSKATSYEEQGNDMYYLAKEKLDEENIPYKKRKASRIEKEDYQKYDLIIGMEEQNIKNIIRILGIDNDKKVYKLLNFCNSNNDISDPWYTGNFTNAYNDILNGCVGLLEYCKNNLL